MHRPEPLTADWFVARGVAASTTTNAAKQIEADLLQIASNPHQFLRSRGEELTDELVLHASARLTIVRVEAAPGAAFPPHDHRMVALIAMLVGEETNTYYRVADDRLDAVRTTRMLSGGTHRMGADVVHSIRNDGQQRSIGLHVYAPILVLRSGRCRADRRPRNRTRKLPGTDRTPSLRPNGARPLTWENTDRMTPAGRSATHS